MSTTAPPFNPRSALETQRDRGLARASGPKKPFNPLTVLAVIGILALGGSALWRTTHSAPQQTLIRIVAAARDLPAGTAVSLMHLKYIDVPKELVNREMTGSLKDVVGCDTRTFIEAGEPIRRYMVFPATGGLSRNLAQNERAITLQLNDDTLVDHTIKPEDRVDVLVVSSKDAQKYTKTICQAARVLITAPKEQMLARHLSSGTMNKITLAVKPDTAEEITEAAEVGKIRLVLRAKTSTTQDLLEGSREEDLLPHSAFMHGDSSAAAGADGAGSTQTASKTASEEIPPPPVDASAAAPNPIEWLVQVFSGSHRETISVGNK